MWLLEHLKKVSGYNSNGNTTLAMCRIITFSINGYLYVVVQVIAYVAIAVESYIARTKIL